MIVNINIKYSSIIKYIAFYSITHFFKFNMQLSMQSLLELYNSEIACIL